MNPARGPCRYPGHKNSTLISIVVVDVRLALFYFHALENAALDPQVEIPLGAVSERYPVETHFPAVQVAAEADGGDGELLGLNVEAGPEVDREFVCNLDVTRKRDGLDQIVFEPACQGVGGDDVVEVIADVQVPWGLEVDGLQEKVRGVVKVGGIERVVRNFGCCARVFLGFGLGIEVPGQGCREVGPGEAESFLLVVDPEKLVVTVPVRIGLVKVEGCTHVDIEPLEQDGTCVDGQRSPAQGVGRQVVGGADSQVVDELDLLFGVHRVFFAQDLHFEGVLEREVQASHDTGGRSPVDVIGIFGIQVDHAVGVGVCRVRAPERRAEIRMVGESDRGGQYMPDGFDGASFELEHPVEVEVEAGGVVELAGRLEAPVVGVH